MDPNECPMCDAGTIAVYRVNATEETVRVCDECDSLWEQADEMPAPATTTVEQYLSSRGLPLLRTQLTALP